MKKKKEAKQKMKKEAMKNAKMPRNTKVVYMSFFTPATLLLDQGK